AHAAAVAVDDEVLEDEPAAGRDELVGTDGVARRCSRSLDVEAAEVERSELHVAAVDVRERGTRVRVDANRKVVQAASADDQEPQATARDRPSESAAVPPRRHWRSTRDAAGGQRTTKGVARRGELRSLLVVQRDERIDPRGATCRKVSCER